MRESLRSPPPAARSDSKPMVEPSGDTRPSWSIAGLLVRSVDTPLRYRYSSKFPDLLDPARMVGLEHAVTVTAIGWAADPLVKVTVAVPAAFPRKKNWVGSRLPPSALATPAPWSTPYVLKWGSGPLTLGAVLLTVVVPADAQKPFWY